MHSIPEFALSSGFRNGPGGTHTSRTMMLAELELLLEASPPAAESDTLRALVVEDNVLLKPTATTRRRSWRALRELYALDPAVTLYRALRDLWDGPGEARPLLALLCATARDPVLRATARGVLETPEGDPAGADAFSDRVAETYPGRYNGTTLASIGRNAASSWTQAGHLQGKRDKVRGRPRCFPEDTAYALLLGHLCGARGQGLFDTLWCRLLDAPLHALRDQAFAASRQGWLEYRHSGMVTEITFRRLLPGEE